MYTFKPLSLLCKATQSDNRNLNKKKITKFLKALMLAFSKRFSRRFQEAVVNEK